MLINLLFFNSIGTEARYYTTSSFSRMDLEQFTKLTELFNESGFLPTDDTRIRVNYTSGKLSLKATKQSTADRRKGRLTAALKSIGQKFETYLNKSNLSDRYSQSLCWKSDGSLLTEENTCNIFRLRKEEIEKYKKLHFDQTRLERNEENYRKHLETIVELGIQNSDLLEDCQEQGLELLRYYELKEEFRLAKKLIETIKDADPPQYLSRIINFADKMHLYSEGSEYEKQLLSFLADNMRLNELVFALTKAGNRNLLYGRKSQAASFFERAKGLSQNEEIRPDTRLNALMSYASYLVYQNEEEKACKLFEETIIAFSKLDTCRSQIPNDSHCLTAQPGARQFLAYLREKNSKYFNKEFDLYKLIIGRKSIFLVGLLRKDGSIVTEPRFRELKLFSEGLAAAKDWLSDRWGYIDSSGAWQITPRFRECGNFGDGIAPAIEDFPIFPRNSELTCLTTLIDKSGKLVKQTPYRFMTPFNQGLSLAYGLHFDQACDIVDRNCRVLFSDKIISPDLGLHSLVFNDLAKKQFEVFVLDGWQDSGCEIAAIGHWILLKIEGQGDKLSIKASALLQPTIKNSRLGYSPTNTYDCRRAESENMSAFCKNNKWGFLGKDDKVAIPAIYSSVGSFSEGLTFYAE